MKKTLLIALIILLLIVVGIFYRRGQQAKPTLSQETMTGAVVQSTGLLTSTGDSFSGDLSSSGSEVIGSTITTCQLGLMYEHFDTEPFGYGYANTEWKNTNTILFEDCTKKDVIFASKIFDMSRDDGEKNNLYGIVYFIKEEESLINGYFVMSGSGLGSGKLVLRMSELGFTFLLWGYYDSKGAYSKEGNIEYHSPVTGQYYGDNLIQLGIPKHYNNGFFFVINELKKEFVFMINSQLTFGKPGWGLPEGHSYVYNAFIESSFINQPLYEHHRRSFDSYGIGSQGSDSELFDCFFSASKQFNNILCADCSIDISKKIRIRNLKTLFSDKKAYCFHEDMYEGPLLQGYVDLTNNLYIKK